MIDFLRIVFVTTEVSCWSYNLSRLTLVCTLLLMYVNMWSTNEGKYIAFQQGIKRKERFVKPFSLTNECQRWLSLLKAHILQICYGEIASFQFLNVLSYKLFLSNKYDWIYFCEKFLKKKATILMYFSIVKHSVFITWF